MEFVLTADAGYRQVLAFGDWRYTRTWHEDGAHGEWHWIGEIGGPRTERDWQTHESRVVCGQKSAAIKWRKETRK